MGAAVGWGALATSSLVLGAALGVLRSWSSRVIGLVLAFGAGALISAVSFELAEQGIALAGSVPVGVGLGAGALVYYALDRVLDPPAPGLDGAGGAPTAGVSLALGAFLDGIPEQLVLGIGLASGSGVSVSLLVAIFVSNVPEAIGSAQDLRARGHARRAILRLWIAVAVVCTAATIVGFALADSVSDEVEAGINGFAAGALLVMLVDSMIPDAARDGGRSAGLVTVLGFALAAALSTVT